MESLKTKVKYTIETTVLSVKEAKQRNWVSGTGADAQFEEASKGWYVHLDGSFEGLYLGVEKPELNPGDKIRITLEKI